MTQSFVNNYLTSLRFKNHLITDCIPEFKTLASTVLTLILVNYLEELEWVNLMSSFSFLQFGLPNFLYLIQCSLLNFGV